MTQLASFSIDYRPTHVKARYNGIMINVDEYKAAQDEADLPIEADGDGAAQENELADATPSIWRFYMLMVLIVLLAALLVFWGLPQIDAIVNPPPPPALQPPLRI